jgi:hypothetical protein
MKHSEISETLQFIRPNAEWSLSGDKLTWLNENQTQPTEAEIKAGWVIYKADQESKAQTNALAKSALLDKLGITEDEAKLLLG